MGLGTAAMFGREAEQNEVLRLLADRRVRLVTVTGRGGVGKTRLAEELALVLRADHVAVVVVELAGVPTADLVASEIAAGLGLITVEGVDVTEALASGVGHDHLVLIVDNFEHVLAAAAVLMALLDRCAGLQVIVTSQTPLRMASERVVDLRPLPLPVASSGGAAELVDQPAVAAYCDTAVRVEPRFELTDANAAAVVDLCRLLEGLPLAIGLAAARAATLPAAEIVRRLDDDSLDLLRRPRGDVPARHHDLRAAIRWTYELLAPQEQALLRWLSVISGSFDLNAVEAAGDDQAFDALAALVDLHLVDPVRGSDPARFEMASSIHTFALEELEARGELEATRRDHIRFRADQALDAAEGARSAQEAEWMHRLTADHDDLLASLSGALDLGMANEALDLAVGLAPFWETRAYVSALEDLFDRALDLAAGQGIVSVAHANALMWSCQLGLSPEADLDVLLERLRRGEQMARDLDDDDSVLRALTLWMLSAPYTGDLARAEAASAEGLERAERTGQERRLAALEAWTGMLASLQGDDERSMRLGLAALARAQRAGDRRTTVLAVMLLLPLRRAYPDEITMIPPVDEVIDMAHATGLVFYAVLLEVMAIGDAVAAGERDGALVRAARSLQRSRTLPGSPVVGYCLMAMLPVAALCGDMPSAAIFAGVTQEAAPSLTINMAPQQVEAIAKDRERVRQALGPTFEAEVAKGAAMTWAQAVEAAISWVNAELTPSEDPAPLPAKDASTLTPRQQEVLELLVTGIGDGEIAAKLGLSAKTVSHHTTAIYRKLDVRGRTEAAIVATRTGLV